MDSNFSPQHPSSKGSEEAKHRPAASSLKTQALPYIPKVPLLDCLKNESFPAQKQMLHYKTAPCPNQARCLKPDSCFYYHSDSERRRPSISSGKLVYASVMCPEVARKVSCPQGDACPYAHNEVERLFHPCTYRTVSCPTGCGYSYCPFAHSAAELRKLELTFAYKYLEKELLSPFRGAPTSPGPFVEPPQAYPSPPMGYKKNSQPVVDLNSFKSTPCICACPHNQKRCIYYHSAADRRRVPVFYSAERCTPFNQGHCPNGDRCTKCHGTAEQLYHPDKYKKKMCREYPDKIDQCEYGSYCCFAHSQAELNIELIHEYEKDADFYMFYFKTEHCPFNHEHNKSICAYTHNWQDFRRKLVPPYPAYSAQMCPNWNPSKFVSEYNEGCIRGMKCPYSHGWKERLFHPMVYKTEACPEMGKCRKGPECPYYHSPSEQRYPDPNVALYPRPRERMSATGSDRRFSEGATVNSPIQARREHVVSMPQRPVRASPLIDPMSKEFTALRVTDASKYTKESDFGTPVVEQRQRHTSGSQGGQPGEEEKKRSTMDQIKDSRAADNGSKSCPTSPLIPIQNAKFGKASIFSTLHHVEEPEEDDSTRREREKLRKFLDSLGLAALSPVLESQYTYLELLVEPETKCSNAGITDQAAIEKIVAGVKAVLARPAGADSPGKGDGE